jgi:beta-carotene 3-hydroxylase
MLLALSITFATVALMELVANLTHKYVMHGWGWGWHESHHTPHDEAFERNDLYAVVFAIPSMLLILLGSAFDHPLLWVGLWVGSGMTIYGFLYFVVHDGLVHNRWPFRLIPKGGYMKRLVQAHRLHHAVHGKHGAVSFGFLYARPVDALKAELQRNHGAAGVRAANDAAAEERATPS